MAVRCWVFSDHHFGHANMLNFRRTDGTPLRPGFRDVDEMDEVMVALWNDAIAPQDHVYHLGDFAMSGANLDKFAPRLNGVKRLIRGNHDMESTNRYIKHGFREIYGSLVRGHLLLTHYPVHPDSIGKHLANVHGHIHANKGPAGRYINVSVEVVDYKPVLLDQLISQAEVLKAQEEALA